MTPEETVRRLPGSKDAKCSNGHELRVVVRGGKVNAIATYRPEEQWWEYVSASEDHAQTFLLTWHVGT